MQITSNTTPYLAELFGSVDKAGRKRCTVVVKATFTVGSAGECRPAAEQVPLVYADEHYADPASTAVRNESDFVPIKPRAEVLLSANAMTPGGRPTTRLEVALSWAGAAKHAVVWGKRVWTRRLWGIGASDPEAFVTMPLAWHCAFGGSAPLSRKGGRQSVELRNPVGLGFQENEDCVVGQQLPNIERFGELIRKWSDRPAPIGFGPVGRGWHPRIGHAGTYDEHWLEQVRPFLPQDFDERYYQAAPLDQQLDELTPGLTFTCIHMSESGRFVARLPELAVPVSFYFEDKTTRMQAGADTVILEPSSGRLVLIGRASVPLPRKPTALREIRVGQTRRLLPVGKLHYRRLSEAVSALRRRYQRAAF